MDKTGRRTRPIDHQTKPKVDYFKTVATNRKAWHEYFIEETVDAGIELHGSEVKSLRSGKANFADAYARVEDGQCWLLGLQISIYEKTFVQAPVTDRKRRLLLHKREIRKLQSRTERSGYTMIPLEIYFRGSYAKIKLGLARGKTKGDKRESVKEEEARKEMRKARRAVREHRARIT